MDLSCPSCRHPIVLHRDASTEGGQDFSHTIESVECPNCGQVPLAGGGDATLSFAQPTHDQPKKLAHFTLTRMLGVGGFGVVWLAQDNDLERQVALKLPITQDHDTESALHEARAAATLHHPNIVSVYEVGRDGDQVFIATEYIEGLTLRDVLSAGKPTIARTVELVSAIAVALQHAHDHGVVHRDVKPANILINLAGKPCIADFGLAKRLSANQPDSSHGRILGTAKYMSPEQAAGKTDETDHRSDIYAVGVILFQMLTASLPFRGNIRAVLHQKTLDEAPSPRALEPALPKDLETICLKCLEREPVKRYQSCSEVVEELQRFAAGEPIRARAISSPERLWRWCRRRPAVASLLAGLFLSLTIGLLGVSTFWLRAEQVAEQNLQALYRSQMNLAAEFVASGDVSGVEQTLSRFIPHDGLPDLRGFEWHYHSQIRKLFNEHWNQGSPVEELTLSRDGDFVASLGSDRAINVFESKTHALIRTLEIEAGRFLSIAFSPVTKQLASGSTDGLVRVWMPGENDQPQQEFRHGPAVVDVEFSADGILLLSASHKGAVRIWNLETEELIAELPTGEGENRDVSLSPNGHFVAVAKEDGRVRVTEMRSMTVRHQFRPNPGIEAIAWSPDGTFIATGSYSGAIRVWSVEEGTFAFEIATGLGQIGDLEFVNDQVVSVVGTSGQLLLLDARTGHELRHLATHTLTQGVLDVSLDGKILTVGSGDGSIKLLDVPSLLKPTVLWHDADVRHVAFMKNGTRLLTADSQGTVTIWNVEDWTFNTVAEGRGVTTKVYATQRARSLLAISGDAATVTLVDTESGEVVTSMNSPGLGPITAMEFSPDGQVLLIGHREGALNRYSVDDWSEAYCIAGEVSAKVNDVAWSSDGRTIVAVCTDKSMWIMDALPSGREAWPISIESEPLAVAFCEKGNVLAVGTSTGELQLWDIKKKSLRTMIKAHTGRINTLSIFPDGRTLASGGRDRRLQLWDTKSGERLTTLRGHSRQLFSIAVSLDGKTVASGGLASDVRVWRGQP